MSGDDELERTLALALDEDAPKAPPAERVAALRARAEAARASAPAPLRRRSGAPWLGVAAALVGVVVGAAVAWLIADGDGGRVAGEVEYQGPMEGPGGAPADVELSIVATGIGRVIELDTAVLPILPTGELYEVWFVGPGDAPGSPNRISAGTFHPDADGHSQVRFAAAVDPELYPSVEITAEPGDGDPAPTGPVVLRVDLPAR